MKFEELKQILEEKHNVNLHKGNTDGQYVLFDNGHFIAEVKFGNEDNSLIFNSKQYTDFSEMLKDITAYNDTLPFVSDYYCPLYNISARTLMAINAYLRKIGLEKLPDSYALGYCLTDISGKVIFALNYEMDDLTKKSSGHIWKMQKGSGNAIEYCKFKDAEEAVSAINSMIESKCLVDIAKEIVLLDKIPDKRDYNLLKRHNTENGEVTDLKSEIKEKLQKVLNSL